MKQLYIIFIYLLLGNGIFAQKSDNEKLSVLERAENLKTKQHKQLENDLRKEKYNEGIPEFKKMAELYERGCTMLREAITESDSTEAINLILISADGGYPPSLSKIAVCYKYGIGVPYDLQKSFQYFDRAANAGFTYAIYSRGFMRYKGLGCSQNYSEAITDFIQCAELGNSECMYMLGLCYRNGFGIIANEAQGIQWLQKSSQMGNIAASKELNNSKAEINDEWRVLIEKTHHFDRLKNLDELNSNEFNRVYDLFDHFTKVPLSGYWIKYDYSGKNIVEVNEIQVMLVKLNDIINFDLEFNDSSRVLSFAGNYTYGHSLTLNETFMNRGDRYVRTNGDKLAIKEIVFETLFDSSTDEYILSGSVQGFSTAELEPERPIKLLLSPTIKGLKTEDGDLGNDLPSILAFPNPFQESINIKFTLKQEANCSFSVLDLYGKSIYESKSDFLTPGTYIIPLHLTVAKGVYFANINFGGSSITHKIIKL